MTDKSQHKYDDGLPPLRDVIDRFGLRARKSLGQNFLLDLNLTRKIARLAGELEEHTIIEIGPGPGGLTRALLQLGAKEVIAIEKDERCLQALEQIRDAYPNRLHIIAGDALEIDYSNLARQCSRPPKIVANLPYNVGTALLIRWLTMPEPLPWSSLTLMFQKEVAERIIAVPGNKIYGRLSVMSQWRTNAQIVMTLPPHAFTPAPKVSSAVVDIRPLYPRSQPENQVLPSLLEKVVAAAFQQRRKMLKTTLKPLFEDPALALQSIGLDPNVRAEQVTVDQFQLLAGMVRQKA